jgi:ATP adenylyltransferase
MQEAGDRTMPGFDRLWDRVVQTTDRALRDGTLQPIPTRFEFVEDRGISFLVRVVDNLRRKRQTLPASGHAPSAPNPFLPYDPQLYVADASETHVCLLNKFNVVDHHLLIVTRHFESQELPLTGQDFRALWNCMEQYDALGFYNGGELAGASQPHKHLQMVPLPLASRGPRVPVESLLRREGAPDAARRCPTLPFRHAVVWLDEQQMSRPEDAARHTHREYCVLMRDLGLARDPRAMQEATLPYNLLLTHQWMLLVPRTRESYHSISLNALAFSGALLVRSPDELTLLRRHGPLQALLHATQQDRP